MKIYKTKFPLACLFFLAQATSGQVKDQIQKLTLQPDEKVWTGVINDGQKMPFDRSGPRSTPLPYHTECRPGPVVSSTVFVSLNSKLPP